MFMFKSSLQLIFFFSQTAHMAFYGARKFRHRHQFNGR